MTRLKRMDHKELLERAEGIHLGYVAGLTRIIRERAEDRLVRRWQCPSRCQNGPDGRSHRVADTRRPTEAVALSEPGRANDTIPSGASGVSERMGGVGWR